MSPNGLLSHVAFQGNKAFGYVFFMVFWLIRDKQFSDLFTPLHCSFFFLHSYVFVIFSLFFFLKIGCILQMMVLPSCITGYVWCCYFSWILLVHEIDVIYHLGQNLAGSWLLSKILLIVIFSHCGCHWDVLSNLQSYKFGSVSSLKCN